MSEMTTRSFVRTSSITLVPELKGEQSGPRPLRAEGARPPPLPARRPLFMVEGSRDDKGIAGGNCHSARREVVRALDRPADEPRRLRHGGGQPDHSVAHR